MYPRQVTEVDELIIDATQSDVLDEDILRLMEKAYVVLESMSIEAIIVSLEQRKIIQLTKEPIKLTDLLTILDKRLLRTTKQQEIEWILPSRPPFQTQPSVSIHPNLNTRLYHGFRGYKVLEWKTCNKVWKEKGVVGSHILHSKMQEVELDKLSLLNLWKEDFHGIGPFNYPYNYIREEHLDEEVDALWCYGKIEPVFQQFLIR